MCSGPGGRRAPGSGRDGARGSSGRRPPAAGAPGAVDAVAVAVAAVAVAAFAAAAPAGPGTVPAAADPSPSAGASCPDQRGAVLDMNASRAWSLAGSRGEGASIDVIGSDQAVAEATCTIKALAPQVAVRALPVPTDGSATQVARQVAAATPQQSGVVLFADESVPLNDPDLVPVLQNAEASGIVIVAAAGDGNSQMSPRPADVINVSAADVASHKLHPGSDFGQRVTLAGYGTDTSYASGYVAAAATLLRLAPGHGKWTVPQMAAQLAGSINVVSGSTRIDDGVGWGIVQPVQALSLGAIAPAEVPGLGALFPDVHPASSAPSGTAAQPTTQLAGATQDPDASAPPATDVLGLPVQPSTAAARSPSSSGGIPLVPVLAAVVLVGLGVTYVQRRRWRAMPEPLKAEDEWEPPQGPRHSGYSSPPE